MVLYDGEKLVTSYNKTNYREILKLAQDYNGEYLSASCAFAFPPIRIVAKKLFELKCPFDDSAKKFISDANEIKNYHIVDLPDTFLPFQKENVNNMIGNKRNILLADDCGTGKTVSLSGYLEYAENSFPCLIVCPSTIKTNWSREISKWTSGKPCIINGVNSYDNDSVVNEMKKSDVVIINYDILAVENEHDKKEFAHLKKKLKKLQEEFDDNPNVRLDSQIKALKRDVKNYNVNVQGWCDILKGMNFKTIICDESQYIESEKAIRTRAVLKICKGSNAKIICSSATPFETKPSQLFTSVNLLAPDLFPDKWKFLYRYCDPVKTRFGWTFNGLTNGEELHRLLCKFMYRHRMEDVLPELPDLYTQAIYIDVNPNDRRKYDQMDNDYINVPSEEKSAYIAELKQELTKAKLPSCIEWIEDYLGTGKKLIVSVYYQETFEYLMKHFGKIAVGINGSTPQNKRGDIVDSFQNDDKIRLFVGQIKAAGTGITLTASDTVVFLELGMTVAEHEQMSKRVKRIGQKSDKCCAIYLLLNDSIDDDRFPVLEERNANSRNVMDGEVTEKFCDLDNAIKLNWTKRH